MDDEDYTYGVYANWDEEDIEKTPVPGVPKSWQEAYEINKKSDRCVLCGKPTKEVELFTSKIKYCECIDVLSKSNK